MEMIEMPTIEVNYQDLQSLIGEHIPLDVLQDEGILYAKGEVEEIEGEMLKLDMKDTNRPDLWSAEGVAREIQGRYTTKRGLPVYLVKPSGLTVKVDPKLKTIRPLTVCAVVKNINITQETLSQMIQLQEKISGTFGRNRNEVAIGVYDYRKIKGPIKFTTVKPDGIKFAPLDFDEKMTPSQILKKHPKGLEFGNLLNGLKEYPIFIDAAGEVLSMPPVINSNHTGKVTASTKDLFIECSGFSMKFLMPALNTIVAALADRGGEVQSVRVEYSNGPIVTPDMSPRKYSINAEYVNSVSGLRLSPKAICDLLEKARYSAKATGNKINLLYPAYRQDIMHPRDVVEDVIISYGFNRITPNIPKVATTGELCMLEKFSDSVAGIMTGMGFQEILSYMLANKENLFRKMSMNDGEVVEIENVVSSNWSVFRSWMLPGMLEFLSKNKHREYPQNVFEIGDAVLLDRNTETRSMDVRKISAVMCDTRVGYESIASVVDALFSSLGIEYELVPGTHPSFMKGRTAQITVNGKPAGILGEINPAVLNSWGIENPVAGFEIEIERMK